MKYQFTDLTVATYLTGWVDVVNASALTDKTKTSYTQIVRDYLIPQLGTIKLKDLHQRHSQRLQDDLLTSRSANTVRIIKRLGYLCKFERASVASFF
jgi:hypothetical protein